MNSLIALIKLILNPKRLIALLSFGHKGYLNTIGWFKAFDKKQAIDSDGNPIPWVTYSFIDFIKNRISNDLNIFEYGSGNSTLFYAQRAKSVISVEHDETWYQKVKNSNPSNAQIFYCKLEPNGEYAAKANQFDIKFDIIIVDGRDRINCCKNSINALTPDGVIILDDSERPEYKPAINYLLEKGFKEIIFSGISPGLFYYKSTSVFYKSNNSLGI